MRYPRRCAVLMRAWRGSPLYRAPPRCRSCRRACHLPAVTSQSQQLVELVVRHHPWADVHVELARPGLVRLGQPFMQGQRPGCDRRYQRERWRLPTVTPRVFDLVLVSCPLCVLVVEPRGHQIDQARDILGELGPVGEVASLGTHQLTGWWWLKDLGGELGGRPCFGCLSQVSWCGWFGVCGGG